RSRRRCAGQCRISQSADPAHAGSRTAGCRVRTERCGMTKRSAIELEVNGVTCDARASGADTLLTVLRDQLLLTGAKRGCNQGVCGACTVLSDGRAVRSCLSLAQNCEGMRI